MNKKQKQNKFKFTDEQKAQIIDQYISEVIDYVKMNYIRNSQSANLYHYSLEEMSCLSEAINDGLLAKKFNAEPYKIFFQNNEDFNLSTRNQIRQAIDWKERTIASAANLDKLRMEKALLIDRIKSKLDNKDIKLIKDIFEKTPVV